MLYFYVKQWGLTRKESRGAIMTLLITIHGYCYPFPNSTLLWSKVVAIGDVEPAQCQDPDFFQDIADDVLKSPPGNRLGAEASHAVVASVAVI